MRYIPNILTIFRMSLAFPLVLFLLEGQTTWALGALLVAGITDLADGFIARNFDASTVFGSWLDPAADKLIITTVLLTLTITGSIPIWFCAVTVTRDLGLVTGTLFLKFRGYGIKIRPYLTGKIATVMQNITLLAAILLPVWPAIQKVFFLFLWTSACLTILSSVTYGRGFWQVYRSKS